MYQIVPRYEISYHMVRFRKEKRYEITRQSQKIRHRMLHRHAHFLRPSMPDMLTEVCLPNNPRF